MTSYEYILKLFILFVVSLPVWVSVTADASLPVDKERFQIERDGRLQRNLEYSTTVSSVGNCKVEEFKVKPHPTNVTSKYKLISNVTVQIAIFFRKKNN
jgi:hypothetical protein